MKVPEENIKAKFHNLVINKIYLFIPKILFWNKIPKNFLDIYPQNKSLKREEGGIKSYFQKLPLSKTKRHY